MFCILEVLAPCRLAIGGGGLMVLGVEPVGAGTMLLCGLDPGFAPSGGRPILGFCLMPDGGVGRAGGRLLKDLKVSSSTSTADAAQSQKGKCVWKQLVTYW